MISATLSKRSVLAVALAAALFALGACTAEPVSPEAEVTAVSTADACSADGASCRLDRECCSQLCVLLPAVCRRDDLTQVRDELRGGSHSRSQARVTAGKAPIAGRLSKWQVKLAIAGSGERAPITADELV